jgi:Cu/Ag efflux protein CusF
VRHLVALALLAAAGACTPAAEEAEVHRYTVAGEIVRLPEAGRPDGAEIYIRHEAVPTFVDSKGETVGMEAMTMGFPLARSLDLTGLAAGDRIEFDFEVRWQGSPPVQVTRVVKAPDAAPIEPADAPVGGDAAEEAPTDHADADHSGH